MSKTQIAGTERPKRKLEEGVNGEKSENERPQKICRPWETTDRDQARDGDIEVVNPPTMEGEESIHSQQVILISSSICQTSRSICLR